MTLGGRRPSAARALLRRVGLSFDGNRGDDVRHWMFADDEFASGLVAETLDALMLLTVEDANLGWVCFPPEGFRL